MMPSLQCHGQEDHEKLAQELSLQELVIWNVSKALERSPNIPLKATIKAMQDNLSRKQTKNLSSNQGSPEQYLTCAVLAWQQLGHDDADSLYSFIESHRTEIKNNQGRASAKVSEKLLADVMLDSGLPPAGPLRHTIGEVVKLPITTRKCIMRMDKSVTSTNQSKTAPTPIKLICQSQEMQFLKEFQCVCDKSCTSCTTRLLQMEEKEKELRHRAEQLSQRETERGELLEKATTAWIDLESKYHSRLNAAKEQAEIAITKMERELEYRKTLKENAKVFAEELKELSTTAEEKQKAMQEVDKEVCQRACQRMSLMEQVKKGDTACADQQCKDAQLDRDLKFKEQQARRKLFAVESDLDSASALLVESERAVRAELTALKEQILGVSEQLLDEDSKNLSLKVELESVLNQKEEMLEDLDGCKIRCDDKMGKDLETLQNKSEQLRELEKKVVECMCKRPEEKSVEVKRTPSLAITCTCIEEGFDSSCKCTTMSTTVLTNLLATLFRGLQSELGDAGIMMPCTLLKCLDDSHNWDKSTPVKSHLKRFFSKLLMGELDIAIAVAIEKYHARWVGSTCADMRVIPNIDDEQAKQMQEKAIERKAQILANKLAEDLFKERAEELTQNAKEICEANPTTCECDDKGKDAAVYSCIVSHNKNPMSIHRNIDNYKGKTQSAGWKQTQQAVLEMKVEIENLKKASIKKQDLRLMEEKIKKVIKSNTPNKKIVEESSRLKNDIAETENISKLRYKSRKDYKPLEKRKGNKVLETTRKLGQSFAVNVCFCEQTNKQLTNSKHSERPKNGTNKTHQTCPSNCICLNSEPNTKSLDEFVENWSKNMQEAHLNVESCRLMQMINNDSKNTTTVKQSIGNVRSETSEQKSKSVIQDPKLRTQKNALIIPKDIQNAKTQNKKQINMKKTNISDANKLEEKTIVQPAAKTLEDSGEKQDERKNMDIVGERKNYQKGFCNCSCFCDPSIKKKKRRNKLNCMCNHYPSQSIFDMIKDTIVKNLGPIIGIESHDEHFCECVNKKIDKSVKSILGTTVCPRSTDLENKDYETQSDSKPGLNSDTGTTTPSDIKSLDDKNILKNKKKKPENNNSKREKKKKTNENRNICDCDSLDESSGSFIESFDETSSFEESIRDKQHKNYLSSSENSRDNQNFDNSKETEQKEHVTPLDHKYKINKNRHKNKSNLKRRKEEFNDMIPQKDVPSSRKENKKIYANNNDIAPVQSEYIGTINLDKSHDDSKESSTYYTQPNLINDKTIGDCSETSCNGESLHNKSPQNYTISREDSMYSNEQKENTKLADITPDLDCGCDYKIKLLGVTLTNDLTDSEKQKNNTKKNMSHGTYDLKPVKLNKTDTVSLQDPKTCICRNETKTESGFTNLEVNTFALLEEYMKKRLEEYRLSCQSHCLNSEKEEQMFNEIFKKVKQTVSENIKQIDCQRVEENTEGDRSKNRAYNLLQEYLKMKINRVTCQCRANDTDKGNILPDLYEKVCNQIENDFCKIRHLCGCDKTNELSDNYESFVRDKNIQMTSAQNSRIPQTENVSSQVSNTGTANKQQDSACGPQAKQFKHIQTGDSTTCTCQSYECCTTPITKNNFFIQQFAPVYNKLSDKFYLEQKSDSRLLEVLKQKSDSISNDDSHKMFNIDAVKPSNPYIGYTMDCSGIYGNSGTCSCPKCTAKRNKNIIHDMWAIYSNLKTPIRKFSYIMSSVPKVEIVDHSFIKTSKNLNANIYNKCNEEYSNGSEAIMLKVSKDKIQTAVKALDTANFSEDIPMVDQSCNTYKKLFDINFNSCVHGQFKDGSSNTRISSLSHSSCDCSKVPVCHVKMLMENIEYKLVECKCTCDALGSSVCPVHSCLPPQ